MSAKTRCFILYTRFLDDNNMMPCMGGVESYIADLGALLTGAGCDVVVCQYAAENFRAGFRGFTVYGVKGATSPKDLTAWIDTQEHDYSRDILIFATDFMITPCKFRNTVAIQHGIAWDEAFLGKTSTAKNYAAALKSALRSIVKTHRYQYCSELVCVDYNFINWYMTQTAGISMRITCIPNYAKVPPEITPKNNRNISIVFARRLVQYRGTRLFADSAANILKKYPDVSITIAGKGPDEEYMRGKLGQFPNVTFTSYSAEDSVDFHKPFTIAAVPTVKHEGTSLALLEAMSAGCAAVSSNIGGLSNILIDGYNGLVINPVQAELEEALEKLITSPELRRKLSENGYSTVKEGFSFVKWSERWLKVIAEMRRS